MTRRRTLGYVENEWTCPNCNSRNKGSLKTCGNCGAPQPENVQFETAAEQKFVTDAEQVKAAQGGADIHCAYCGTRNTATAEVCIQCGADLKEGKAREAGRIMQAPPAQPKIIKCNNCGTENPGTNAVCANCGSPLPRAVQPLQAQAGGAPSTPGGLRPAAPINAKTNNKRNFLILGAIMACLAAICVGVLVLFVFPTSSVQGTVTDVTWETFVPVQEIRAVDYSNQRGNPPSDAYNVSCRDESRDVCENKTVDKGNGYSEVVQECHTETERYCSYTLDEWTTIQTYTLQGNDLRPIYDDPSLASGQRIGDESEKLTVTFSTEDGDKVYNPGSVTEFQQFDIGSTWTLKMNLVGGVVGVE